MQTRFLVLVVALGTAGCATTQHRVSAAPPATPTSTTTATAAAPPVRSQPLAQEQGTKFYTPTESAQPLPQPNSDVATGGSVQSVQPVQPLYQSNVQSQGTYAGTPSQGTYTGGSSQGYARSGLNSDPGNPSGAPGSGSIGTSNSRY